MKKLLIFFLFLISNVLSEELDEKECFDIRNKISKNMAVLDAAANTAKLIKQKDCEFAKNSIKLTKKYGKCLPTETERGLAALHKNMRSVVKMICENVNKRIRPCFSPENLKQFNQCTNKTLQYLDFVAKQNKDVKNSTKINTRRKRFLLKYTTGDLFDDSDVSGYEHQCCMLHLKSDCFLSRVLHHCTDSSDLRLAKIFQTFVSFAVRDVVDIACGRFEKLEQCEKFSKTLDSSDELGF